jgi:ABC-type uncharacterized transport system substrate-binding protein
MSNNIVIWLLGIFFLTTVSLAEAQQPKKVPRIGYLSAGSASSNLPRMEAFRQGLRDLGYIEGKNISIEYRFAEGEYARLPDLAVELVHLNVNVIVTNTTIAAHRAKQATQMIPIVFVNVGDSVSSGLVASLAHPGGNVTGLTNVNVELTGKQMELLKESIPGLTRVAVLLNATGTTAQSLRETQAAAQSFGVLLQIIEVRDPKDFNNAFSTIIRSHAGAVLVLPDPMLTDHRRRIAELATQSRLPIIHWNPDWPEAGGLMSYGPSNTDMHRRAATFVDKILKGAKPADLPVEQPMKFELVINLKTAKQIGLTIPPNVLARADKVIR